MDVCHSSPAWVGYGSQGPVRKTAKPGYASRAVDDERRRGEAVGCSRCDDAKGQAQ